MTQRAFSWMNPKLEIRPAPRYGRASGKGVFATVPVRKGETLFVMGGYILNIADENRLRGVVADKPIEISEDFSIGPLKPSDLARMPQHWVNHSCDPNAGFDGQIFMVAMRSIRAGSEVVYDYGMVMHPNEESDTYFSFACLCGSPKCRGTITEDDWRRPELQKRYDGYFQHFLQKKIDKLKGNGQ